MSIIVQQNTNMANVIVTSVQPARKRSWPAVSQICSLIFWPATSMMRVPNSTPIVCGQLAMTERDRIHIQLVSRKFGGIRALTLFLGELMQQTRFPDAHVTDDDVLENVVVVVRTARHSDGDCAWKSKQTYGMSHFGNVGA